MKGRSGRERERPLGWRQAQTNTGEVTDEPLRGELNDAVHNPKQGDAERRED